MTICHHDAAPLTMIRKIGGMRIIRKGEIVEGPKENLNLWLGIKLCRNYFRITKLSKINQLTALNINFFRSGKREELMTKTSSKIFWPSSGKSIRHYSTNTVLHSDLKPYKCVNFCKEVKKAPRIPTVIDNNLFIVINYCCIYKM